MGQRNPPMNRRQLCLLAYIVKRRQRGVMRITLDELVCHAQAAGVLDGAEGRSARQAVANTMETIIPRLQRGGARIQKAAGRGRGNKASYLV